jgi:hypothetical protein
MLRIQFHCLRCHLPVCQKPRVDHLDARQGVCREKNSQRRVIQIPPCEEPLVSFINGRQSLRRSPQKLTRHGRSLRRLGEVAHIYLQKMTQAVCS